MLAENLDLLISRPAWPSISLLGPPRERDLHELLSEARNRLPQEVDDATASTLLVDLEGAIDKARHCTTPAVGIFVNESLVHIVELPSAVRARVVVDHDFATRDLAVALARGQRYLILTLDGSEARLHAGLGDRVVEVGSRAGFPVRFDDAPTDSERRHRRERSKDRDAQMDREHRLVDGALTAAIHGADTRPLFVAGAQRRAHRFAERSAHASRIAAIVAGATATGDALLSLVRDARDEELERRHDDALRTLDAAIKAGRFASGIAELWAPAHEGRVDLLVVEADHHAPIVLEGGMPQVVPSPVPGQPDDAVDEIIEAVIEAGGRVQPVSTGRLADHDRIAARLRH